MNLRNASILIIDDDQDDLDVIKEAIAEFDSSILSISFIYPREAVRVICNELIALPDYIFTDINMPLMAGDECLKQLRSNKLLNDTIITVLSTSIPVNFSMKLKEMGADYTFQKPPNIAGYKDILTTVFQTELGPRGTLKL